MDIYFETFGARETPVMLWAHGWGQDHSSLTPLARSFEGMARHLLVDFPGFGKSAPPPEDWDTETYADALALFIKEQSGGPVVWIGHSFGCRVGIQLAAKYPELVSGLFLIAAAGLPRPRKLWETIYFKSKITLFKSLKKIIPASLHPWLLRRFASPDYLNAGPMRKILVRVVNENLSAQAQKISCPVMLVYGENDLETPPAIGEEFKTLIPNAQMLRLAGLDHYTILSGGRHQVAPHLKKLLDGLR